MHQLHVYDKDVPASQPAQVSDCLSVLKAALLSLMAAQSTRGWHYCQQHERLAKQNNKPSRLLLDKQLRASPMSDEEKQQYQVRLEQLTQQAEEEEAQRKQYWSLRAHINLGVFADARDWCAALFAFYGLLRIKEYTCSGLLHEHVSVHSWGISLAIPFSKTSLVPTAVAIVHRDDELCPVAAHSAYTRHLPLRLRSVGVPRTTPYRCPHPSRR